MLLFCCLLATSRGQGFEGGVRFGALSYLGDLNPSNPVYFTSAGVEAQIKYNFNAYWALKFNALLGELRFKDSWSSNVVQKERNLSFYTPIYEYSLQFELNFLKYVTDFEGDKYFTPYFSGGLGVLSFDPRRDVNGKMYHLQWYGTEGQNIANSYSTWTMTMPVGFGIKQSYGRNWNLIFSIDYHYTFTRYLDDVSDSYPDASKLYNDDARMLSDPSVNHIGSTGRQRGTTNSVDKFIFVGLGLTYTFIGRECRSVIRD